jgi:spoIIIJ-associated protein
MEWVETTGRTVEEAKKAALDQLGVEEADAEFEVIAEPKLGLFGRLREEARVRARVQPRYPRSKGERRDRRRGRGGSHPDHHAPATPTTTATDDEAVAPSTEEAPTGGQRGAPRERRDEKDAPRRRRSANSAATTDKGGRGPASFGDVGTPVTEDQLQQAEDFLKGLLDEFGATATVSSHQLADGIGEVEIDGDGLSTLIGPKGATLLALQELTRTVLQRQSANEGRVVIDINGYRKRRQEALARFAQQVASEVKASGVKRALEPMPAPDRKVVHDAVNDIEGVKTLSEGEEPNRRVVLVPDSAVDAVDDDAAEPLVS